MVKLIPKGRITSYGAIAAYLGAKRSSRMVGWALNESHNLTEKIPAHRVVNRNRLLTGKAHFSSIDEMQNRLENENITVVDNQVQHFQELFWDPSKALAL